MHMIQVLNPHFNQWGFLHLSIAILAKISDCGESIVLMIILLCRFLKVCYKHYNPKQKYNAYYTDSRKHEKLFRQKQDNRIFFVVKYPVIIAKNKLVKGNKYPVKVSIYK